MPVAGVPESSAGIGEYGGLTEQSASIGDPGGNPLMIFIGAPGRVSIGQGAGKSTVPVKIPDPSGATQQMGVGEGVAVGEADRVGEGDLVGEADGVGVGAAPSINCNPYPCDASKVHVEPGKVLLT